MSISPAVATGTTRAAVVDLGVNNLASIRRGLEDAGTDRVDVLAEPDDLSRFTHVVLPGVGAFSTAMEVIERRGWREALAALVSEGRIPLLGVCLGMQLLGDGSEEGDPVPGLGVVPGRTVRIVAARGERIPHVGWNEVTPAEGARLFAGISPGTDFYFVHSYVFRPADAATAAAFTPYGGDFVSAVQHGPVFGMQFHPEKSSKAGLRVLRNFVALRLADAEGTRDPDVAVQRLRAG